MTGPPEVEMMDFFRPAEVDIAEESEDYRMKKGETETGSRGLADVGEKESKRRYRRRQSKLEAGTRSDILSLTHTSRHWLLALALATAASLSAHSQQPTLPQHSAQPATSDCHH